MPEGIMPRQHALVRLAKEHKNWLESNDKSSPLLSHEVFVYLGEIPNMRGHCIVVGHPHGAVMSGYHVDNFEEVPE